MEAGGSLKRVAKGDPYRWQDQNAVVDKADQAARVWVSGAHAIVSPLGTLISVEEPEWTYAIVTAIDATGATTWQEVLPQTGGGWVNGERHGDPTNDPAYEISAALPAVFPFKVILRRSPMSDTWLYSRGC